VESAYLFELYGRELSNRKVDNAFAPSGSQLFYEGSGWSFGNIDYMFFQAVFQPGQKESIIFRISPNISKPKGWIGHKKTTVCTP